MAIDLNIPVIAPPSALDLANGGEQEEDPQAQVESITPPQMQQTSVVGSAQPLGSWESELGPVDLNPFGEGDEGISRWSPELVQQATSLIDRDIARAQRDAEVSLAEHHSQRGTVGSSIESWSQQEMLTNLETERMRRLTDLNIAMANAFAEDRATAASVALQQRAQQLQELGMSRDEAFRRAQLEQQASQFQQQFGLQERSFTESQRQFDLQLQVQNRALELQQLGMDRDESFRRAQLEVQQSQFQQEMEFNRYSLDRTLDMRAQELMQQADQFGQQMSLEQARLQAQTEQFAQTLEFQRQSFAEQMGFNREQLAQQAAQFQAELADRNAERLHQMGLQQSQQEWASYENMLNRALESRALDLQQAQFDAELGFRREALSAEASWRQADRELEILLQDRALALQREGMIAEDAYRQAMIELDRDTLSFQSWAASWDIYIRGLALDVDMPDRPVWGDDGGGGGLGDWDNSYNGGNETLDDFFDQRIWNDGTTIMPSSVQSSQADADWAAPSYVGYNEWSGVYNAVVDGITYDVDPNNPYIWHNGQWLRINI